jgi:hypothetical protein
MRSNDPSLIEPIAASALDDIVCFLQQLTTRRPGDIGDVILRCLDERRDVMD